MNDETKAKRSSAAKTLWNTYISDKPDGFKKRRIKQLAEMHTTDPPKMGGELEAMAEILYALEEDSPDPRIKVLTALMADLTILLAIQYLTSKDYPPEKT